VVVHDQDLKLVAQLAGYDDRKFPIRPLAQQKKNEPVKIKLVKAVGRAPNTVKVIKTGQGSGAGSGRAPDRTGGDLHTDPYGTLPKK
jgi:hypothetical protein